MPTQLVNTRGHYPEGYPRNAGGPSGTSSYSPSVMEKATDEITEEQLQTFKTAISDATGASLAQDYFTRNHNARSWWYSRWDYQTVDGRKWGSPQRGVAPWPWPGASDTRVRTVEKVIGQYQTLQTFATRNMKMQVKSTRPAVTIKQSQQATTLLNWMLFTHMQAEMHREMRLNMAWRNGYGASVLTALWLQRRRLDYIDVNVMGLQEFVNEPAVQAFIGENQGNIPIGENLEITDLQEMIMDPAYADDLARLLVTVSHDYLTLKQARGKLDLLRQVRTVKIPIPYVFESRPQVRAWRPMVDVLFPVYTDDFQIAPWTALLEYVSETALRDRIVTRNYDEKFVNEALEHRGPSSNADWRLATNTERVGITGVGPSNLENDIELVHFYTLSQDRGVPVRFCTVMHMDVDIVAKHEPDGYKHGESCLHPFRFEINDRPILTSRGIAEIAATWEQEFKNQYDAWSDRTALSLRPPLITTYDQVQKIKETMQPGVVFPMRKFDEAQFLKMPTFDQASILVVQEIEKRVNDHFAIFGNEVDPQLKKLRQEEVVDDLLLELKPVVQQIMKLMREFLPDEDVAKVVGPLSRPFQISRSEIQGEWEISATVDLRNIDSDWLEKKLDYFAKLAQMDTMGLLDKAALLKAGAEAIDYSFAEMAIQNPQVATEAEWQEEQRTIDLIIGSGSDQPMPKGANYEVRLDALQKKLQTMQGNPATMQIIQGNPLIMQVIMKRAEFFQRQLQQRENAKIGAMQVTQTFNKNAPQVAQPMGAMNGQEAGGGGGSIGALLGGGGRGGY